MTALPSGSDSASGGFDFEPAALGRRAAARVVDVALATLLTVVVPYGVVGVILSGGAAEAIWLAIAAPAAYGVAALAALLAAAATPGQYLLGLCHVDAQSGVKAPGKLFLKLLLQTLTFGLWIVITPLSIQPPNRSWFDRTAGVVVLDARRLMARTVPGHAPAVGAPPAGWQSDGHLTQIRPVGEVGPADGSGSAEPAPAGGSMIRSVPFDLSQRQGSGDFGHDRRGIEPPSVAPRVVHVRESQTTQQGASVSSVPGSLAAAGNAELLVLDDGRRVPVDGLIIMGRAPIQRPALGEATLVTLVGAAVSANHVAFGRDAGLWVMDLRSSNGTHLLQDGEPVRLPPSERVPIGPGARVRVGGQLVTVERSR